jgi:hypothetical protein
MNEWLNEHAYVHTQTYIYIYECVYVLLFLTTLKPNNFVVADNVNKLGNVRTVWRLLYNYLESLQNNGKVYTRTISDVCFMFIYGFCSKHFPLWYTFKQLESVRAQKRIQDFAQSMPYFVRV